MLFSSSRFSNCFGRLAAGHRPHKHLLTLAIASWGANCVTAGVEWMRICLCSRKQWANCSRPFAPDIMEWFSLVASLTPSPTFRFFIRDLIEVRMLDSYTMFRLCKISTPCPSWIVEKCMIKERHLDSILSFAPERASHWMLRGAEQCPLSILSPLLMGCRILPPLLLQGHRVLLVMLRYYLGLVARLCLHGLNLEADFPSNCRQNPPE